ncbi:MULTISPECIES: NRDE family protein [unclassified Wenzhouxiangella]|uniref:NRDE family protein n=1 Tax=unclassified Wenzhouxiangella TaxID=2613841 RepID=UPI000E32AC54|nr:MULTISPECIES: NRDE family protein [unclassified Wenzhouxiangella]RFF27050.1 NRDE family protein [Wenzhouxiangella sp. 15181]RFP69411.1 NRDE family protein [Wenzhouxiangella sp. 15190]
MCLIAFSFSPGQERHLLLAANRDEFHERPARPMAWWCWPDGPLAGRDERAGGTWIATGRNGRWAAVTNFRDPDADGGERSRGELPLRFLESGDAPETFVHEVDARRSDYAPFNLLAGDRETLWYCSSHARPAGVSAGVHALSNGLLDEPWPKTRRAATALRGLDSAVSIDTDRLFELMNDRERAPDADLPDTGVGAELERFLSSPFIVGERYGTRCTTILSLGERGLAAERAFDSAGHAVGELRYGFGPQPLRP